MKILITGSSGQLGEVLKRTNPGQNECIFFDKNELNITDHKKAEKIIYEIKPDWIINAAAFTKVDKAEEFKKLTFQINADGPKNLCKILNKYGGRLLQISTDFVFNGKQSHPYSIDDDVDPISVYGESKVLAEKYILNYCGHIILRTGWIYSDFGENFLLKILELQKKYLSTNQPFKVIADQVGTPTSAYSLANLCWKIVNTNKFDKSKTFIFHWSDAGLASWYDFANAILDLSKRNGLFDTSSDVIPILTKDLKLKALRPKYSVLNSYETNSFFNLQSSYWRDELNKVLKKIVMTSSKK